MGIKQFEDEREFIQIGEHKCEIQFDNLPAALEKLRGKEDDLNAVNEYLRVLIPDLPESVSLKTKLQIVQHINDLMREVSKAVRPFDNPPVPQSGSGSSKPQDGSESTPKESPNAA